MTYRQTFANNIVEIGRMSMNCDIFTLLFFLINFLKISFKVHKNCILYFILNISYFPKCHFWHKILQHICSV